MEYFQKLGQHDQHFKGQFTLTLACFLSKRPTDYHYEKFVYTNVQLEETSRSVIYIYTCYNKLIYLLHLLQ